MHDIQKQLLDYIDNHSAEEVGSTELARYLNINHPQKVVHHLQQLEKKGYIRKKSDGTFALFKDPVKPIEYFPLLGMAQCGADGIYQEHDIEELIPIPTKTFDIRNPKEYFFVKAVNDSMEPIIHDQDYVLIHQEPFSPNNSNIALVFDDGHAKLKQLEPSKEDELIVLKSLNPKYKKQFVNRNELRVLGYVHRIISR